MKAADGNAELRMRNHDAKRAMAINVIDVSYGSSPRVVNLGPAGGKDAAANLTLDLPALAVRDIRVRWTVPQILNNASQVEIETGRESFSDPCMGRA